MILEQYYLDDLKVRIAELPEEMFQTYSPYLKRDVLNNLHGVLERLWYIYQKDIEEFDCDEPWSYRDALSEVCSIPMEINIGDPETKI